MEKLAIENLKEIAVAGAKTYGALVQAKKNDGKIDMNDIALILPLIPQYTKAIENAGDAIPELKDLDAEEAAQLVAAVLAELGGVEADVQVKVEKVLLALKANYEAYKAFA